MRPEQPFSESNGKESEIECTQRNLPWSLKWQTLNGWYVDISRFKFICLCSGRRYRTHFHAATPLVVEDIFYALLHPKRREMRDASQITQVNSSFLHCRSGQRKGKEKQINFQSERKKTGEDDAIAWEGDESEQTRCIHKKSSHD